MITICKGCHDNEQQAPTPGLKLANAFGVSFNFKLNALPFFESWYIAALIENIVNNVILSLPRYGGMSGCNHAAFLLPKDLRLEYAAKL